MDEYTALELFTEQLKRELAEALAKVEEQKVTIEQYKLSETYWIARTKKAEAVKVDSRIACRR